MIFVTVGTHEQQFDRLLKKIDDLKKESIITDEVVMQTGFSSYEPQYCEWKKIMSYKEMQKNISEARIVITHGGPSSFISPLQIGKVPIVVPRQKKYKEHVNNHQLDFSRQIEKRLGSIIVVEEVDDLKRVVSEYGQITDKMSVHQRCNNEEFNLKLTELVNGMFSENDRM